MKNSAESTNDAFPLDNEDLMRQSVGVSASAKVFDPFFGIKIESPRFSLDVFNTYCNELKKTRVGSLVGSTPPNAVFMAVIVESTGIRKSANNKDYLIWHLSDLMSDQKVKLLIFGDAAQSHWKLQVGSTVAITHPETANDDSTVLMSSSYSKDPAFKVTKSLQIMSLGLCCDFGMCAGLCKNGERCTNYVNTALSPVCAYHIQAEAKKLRSFRGSLSAISNESPRYQMARSPRKRKRESESRKSSRSKSDKENVSVNLFTDAGRSDIASRARIGHKHMTKLTEMIENETNQQTPKPATPKPIKTDASTNVLRDFINRKTSMDRIKRAAKRVGAPLNHSIQHDSLINLASPMKSQPSPSKRRKM